MNNYYVYLHKLNLNNEVFYVGKGKDYRAYAVSGRTKEWIEKSKLGYSVEIVENNLLNEQAISLEKSLFIKHSSTIVNKVKPCIVGPVNFEYLNSLFEISESSPSFLLWKKDAELLNQGIRRLRGKKAGRLSSGYWSIRLFQKNIKVHRIIYALTNRIDLCSNLIIDHIDGCKSNNNPCNLRAASYAINARNKLNNNKRKNEETNVTGVTRVKFKTYDYYMVQWRTLDYRNRSKCFNIKIHGEQLALKLAVNYREEQIRLLNLEGAGYTERHGT